MQGFSESSNDGRIADILVKVFAQFACFIEERPRFGNLCRHQLNDDVHRRHSFKIIREVCPDAEGRETFPLRELLNCQCVVSS